MHTVQTAWERPRDNIRKPGVRDPLQEMSPVPMRKYAARPLDVTRDNV